MGVGAIRGGMGRGIGDFPPGGSYAITAPGADPFQLKQVAEKLPRVLEAVPDVEKINLCGVPI